MEAITTLVSAAVSDSIKNLAKEMSSFVAEKVSEYYKDITNKELVDSGWAFEDYLYKTRDMYSKSKTILYRDEKKEIKEFFEPPVLYKEETHLRRKPRSFFISSENLEEIFMRSGHSKVLITGIGGMGKTILLKHLCVNAIDTGYKIPIFISLRWFNDMEIKEEPLERLIYDRLKINGFNLDYKYFKYSLEGNKYVVLFDGYDEISVEKQSVITRKIADFTQQYSDNHFIITSRPVEQISCWNEYRLLELCPLKLSQVENLILKLQFDSIPKKRFIDELKIGLYEEYRSFVSIPLTLSILFITYVENTTIPEALPEFYEMSFSTLLYRHDKLKEGYERVLKSKIGRHEFRAIFSTFCFETYFKDAYSFSEQRLIEYISSAVHKCELSIDPYAYKDDLVDVVCMLVRDGREYSFLHRSFQEYFAAYYVSQKPDEQQAQLCSAIINSDLTAAIDKNNHFRNTKGMDFLTMLNQIESQRFESIVLLPILEKLYKLSLECDGDLFEMLYRYFRFKTVHDDEDSYCEYYYLLNDRHNALISFNEFFVLLYFYTDLIEKRDDCSRKEIEKAMSKIEKNRWDAINIVSTDNRNLVSFGIYEGASNREILYAACGQLVSGFNTCLKRYSELSSDNMRSQTFMDMINRF